VRRCPAREQGTHTPQPHINWEGCFRRGGVCVGGGGHGGTAPRGQGPHRAPTPPAAKQNKHSPSARHGVTRAQKTGGPGRGGASLGLGAIPHFWPRWPAKPLALPFKMHAHWPVPVVSMVDCLPSQVVTGWWWAPLLSFHSSFFFLFSVLYLQSLMPCANPLLLQGLLTTLRTN